MKIIANTMGQQWSIGRSRQRETRCRNVKFCVRSRPLSYHRAMNDGVNS